MRLEGGEGETWEGGKGGEEVGRKIASMLHARNVNIVAIRIITRPHGYHHHHLSPQQPYRYALVFHSFTALAPSSPFLTCSSRACTIARTSSRAALTSEGRFGSKGGKEAGVAEEVVVVEEEAVGAEVKKDWRYSNTCTEFLFFSETDGE